MTNIDQPKTRENTTYEETVAEVEQALANFDINADIGNDAFPGVGVYLALGRMQDKIGEGLDRAATKDFFLTMREMTESYEKVEDKVAFATKVKEGCEKEFARLKDLHDNPPTYEKGTHSDIDDI